MMSDHTTEIERLRAVAEAFEESVVEKMKRIEELEKLTEAPLAAMLMYEQHEAGETHIITTEQIDAAWAVGHCRCDEAFTARGMHSIDCCEEALNELGIVRCERCAKLIHRVSHGGLPGVDDICPNCHGHGWTIHLPNPTEIVSPGNREAK
jgi:hypothetical protein